MATTERMDQPAEVATKVLRRAQVSKVRPPYMPAPPSALDANLASEDDPDAAEPPRFGQCQDQARMGEPQSRYS